MAKKMKTRRCKKMRMSSKKRKQSKSHTKKHRKTTRKIRGGVKRNASNTPRQENSPIETPSPPRRTRARQNNNNNQPVGVNLFQGVQQNVNPNIPIVTPPRTPIQGVYNHLLVPPATPEQQQQRNYNLVEQDITPQGNLSDEMEGTYIDSITTPRDQIVRGSDYEEAIISPLPYEDMNSDFLDTDDEDEDENI